MTDAAMDFKVGLLKRQLCAAAASVFKPIAGDASTANGTAQDARPADSFHASGDEERSNAVKVGWPLPLPMKPTDVGSISAFPNHSSRRRHLDSSTPPSQARFDLSILLTIIQTGPTPPMKSESPLCRVLVLCLSS